MNKNFYLSTPIFYPNDRLHLGHAYTMIIADIIVRYKKSKNYKIYFQTGSDDHGEKIEKKAFSLNISPQELVNNNVLLFQQLWKELGISEHVFYRTSSSFHKEKVQKIFTELLKKDDIYLGEYQGKYCIACEDYVSDSKAVNNLCPTPNCQSELRKINEPAYFLRVSKYYSALVKHYSQNPDFLLPFNIKKELFENFLKNDIRDLCITRSDIKWGISVPNNEKMVIYVWFEALLNYLNSEEGEKAFISPNAEIIHLIGKEITRFHAIYWPIILFSLDKRLPNKILAHGWLITPTGKMSKSKGNVINPLKLLAVYPKDLLRTYFIAKISFLQDGTFSEKLLREFYKDFFINNLGNLCSRVWKMLEIYNDSIIPLFEESENIELIKYHKECLLVAGEFQKKFDNYQLTLAFQEIQRLINLSNKLVQDLEPWKLFKEKKITLLNQTLNHLINGIKIVSFLLNIIVPDSSAIIFQYLNLDCRDIDWENVKEFRWVGEKKIKKLEKAFFSFLPEK